MLFHGGPVSTEGRSPWRWPARRTRRPVGFRRVFGQIGLVDLDTPVELVDGVPRRLRIFAGYAGWGAEQLVDEIEEGTWYVVPGRGPTDVFRDDPRPRALARRPAPPARELAWLSTRPVDPDLN